MMQSFSLSLFTDVTATDSLSREFLKLRQFTLVSKVKQIATRTWNNSVCQFTRCTMKDLWFTVYTNVVMISHSHYYNMRCNERYFLFTV